MYAARERPSTQFEINVTRSQELDRGDDFPWLVHFNFVLFADDADLIGHICTVQ